MWNEISEWGGPPGPRGSPWPRYLKHRQITAGRRGRRPRTRGSAPLCIRHVSATAHLRSRISPACPARGGGGRGPRTRGSAPLCIRHVSATAHLRSRISRACAARGRGTTPGGAHILMRSVCSDGARFAFPHALANQLTDHGEEFWVDANGRSPDRPQLAVFRNRAGFRIQVV